MEKTETKISNLCDELRITKQTNIYLQRTFYCGEAIEIQQQLCSKVPYF